jgi:hypothetical protein
MDAPGRRSSTFHGRDVFAPAAAHAAKGDDWTAAGPPIEHPVRLDIQSATIEGDAPHGEVIATDGPYGNLLTNVDGDPLRPTGLRGRRRVEVTFGTRKLTLRSRAPSPTSQPDSRSSTWTRAPASASPINHGRLRAATHKIAIPTPLTIPHK